MKLFLAAVVAFILTINSEAALARGQQQTDAEAVTSVKAAFEEILDLWRDARYDELYERTQRSGKVAKEDFANRLENSTTKPACCWQKMQDVSVHVENNDFAVVRAKIGLEGDGDIKFKTRSYKLVREGNTWRISQSDLISLAGAKKTKKGHRARH